MQNAVTEKLIYFQVLKFVLSEFIVSSGQYKQFHLIHCVAADFIVIPKIKKVLCYVVISNLNPSFTVKKRRTQRLHFDTVLHFHFAMHRLVIFVQLKYFILGHIELDQTRFVWGFLNHFEIRLFN